jgi:hypothetical protein
MTAAKIIPAMQTVSTGNLNTAVRRNLSRFPADFMFQFTEEEAEASSFQIGILKQGVNVNKQQGRVRHSVRAAIHI